MDHVVCVYLTLTTVCVYFFVYSINHNFTIVTGAHTGKLVL